MNHYSRISSLIMVVVVVVVTKHNTSNNNNNKKSKPTCKNGLLFQIFNFNAFLIWSWHVIASICNSNGMAMALALAWHVNFLGLTMLCKSTIDGWIPSKRSIDRSFDSYFMPSACHCCLLLLLLLCLFVLLVIVIVFLVLVFSSLKFNWGIQWTLKVCWLAPYLK